MLYVVVNFIIFSCFTPQPILTGIIISGRRLKVIKEVDPLLAKANRSLKY
jgi:hypothetical protein